MITINIVMMFNNSYAITSGSAIYSLLKNANKSYHYQLYIMYNDITEDNQNKIKKVISNFTNASLKFIYMNNKFAQFGEKMGYPIEILYKFCMPSYFPKLDKIIVTDVDVVFTGDISYEYINFTGNEYFAGAKQTQHINHPPFSKDITDKNYHFVVGAGYMIYNLKKMREDNIESKCIEYLTNNIKHLKLVEQEVLSQVCYPNIKLLHPKNMMLNTWCENDDNQYLFEFSYTSTEREHTEAKDSPIQIHYVSPEGKPWENPYIAKANLWYRYLSYTPFFQDHFKWLEKRKKSKKKNKIIRAIKKILRRRKK